MLSFAIDLLLPKTCIGCSRNGTVWCTACQNHHGQLRRVQLAELAGGPACYTIAEYSGLIRAALLAYKERGQRELAQPLANLLIPALRTLTPHGTQCWLVPVPSKRAVARLRGSCHMTRLARQSARYLDQARVVPLLGLARTAKDSVGLTKAERQANLRNAVHWVGGNQKLPANTTVIVLDDVVTTGTTIAACAAVLRAHEVHATAALTLMSVAN